MTSKDRDDDTMLFTMLVVTPQGEVKMMEIT